MARNLIEIENARLVYRNFEGRPDDFNPKGGQRGFGCVIEDDKTLDKLMNEGFKIKYMSNGDEPDIPYIKVKVKYGDYPPRIFMKSGKKTTELNEDTVKLLDDADIVKVNLIISPYPYEIKATGLSGVAAYVKTMYVTVAVDRFAAEFFEDDEEEEIPF